MPGDRAMLVIIAQEVFGRNILFYFVTATIFIILIMAANTAYSGFPMLVSVMAKEGYAPRQLSMRGDRLSYDNGITVLSIVSILLIIIFKADVSRLIGLYAIGVFISFTLSQSGMFLKWLRQKGRHWILKAIINGMGALVTCIVVVIIAFTKFTEGAYIVVVLIPVMIFMMLKVKKHYVAVQKQLRISPEELENFEFDKSAYRNRVIVPVESVNNSSVRALRFAKTISDNITAFSIVINMEDEAKIREKYNKLNTGIPLIVRYSPYRKVVEPLLNFIESAEYNYMKGDMITVILPKFVVKKWWQRILHNNTSFYVEKELLKHHKHIVVSVMPLQLKGDKETMNNPKYQ